MVHSTRRAVIVRGVPPAKRMTKPELASDTAPQGRSWVNRRCPGTRVNEALNRDFGYFEQDVRDNYKPPGVSVSLRVAVANWIFPEDGSEHILGTGKIAEFRARYAYGSIAEAMLKLTPAEEKVRQPTDNY